MHLSAYVELPRFYVSAFDACDQELVIIRDREVRDCCERAAKRGVARGQSRDAARRIAPGARFIPYREADHRSRAERWWKVLNEYSDAVEPIDLHAAFVDFTPHPQPDAQLAKLQRDVTRASGCDAKVALSTTRWRAIAAVRYGTDDLFALPVAAAPISSESVARVTRMGYSSLGDVATIPWIDLRGWLGEDGPILYEAARGRGPTGVAALWPPDSMVESFRFDGATDDRQHLERSLVVVAAKLGSRLQEADGVCTALIVTLEREDGRLESLARPFAQRTGDRPSITAALRAILEREPFEPIEAIRVRLTGVISAEGHQLRLGESSGAGSLESHLRTLSAAMTERVAPASSIARPRRRSVLEAWSNAIGWV